jgi:hypothetical protein
MEGGNKAWAHPLVVKFTAKEPGKVTLKVSGASATGGNLSAWVNDKQVLDQAFDPSGQGSRQSKDALTIDYPAGPVVLRLENHGKDWVKLDSISVPGLAPTANTHGLGEANWALIRIFGSDTSEVTVKGLPLPNGSYPVKVFDAAMGGMSRSSATVKDGRVDLKGLPSDSVIAISAHRD